MDTRNRGEALGNEEDGKLVVEKMKELPTDDPLFARARSGPMAGSWVTIIQGVIFVVACSCSAKASSACSKMLRKPL